MAVAKGNIGAGGMPAGEAPEGEVPTRKPRNTTVGDRDRQPRNQRAALFKALLGGRMQER